MKKVRIKLCLDIIMTALLVIQMGYHITGEEIHKWLGIMLSVLFILHHILNRGWYKSILKGKYSAVRIFQASIDVLLMVSMVGIMLSGVMLARDIFGFLPLRAGSFARSLHMSCTVWGFVMASFHIGQHWGMMLGKIKRKKEHGRLVKWGLRCTVLAYSLYGIVAFISRGLGKLMFLRVRYAFFEFGEPFIVFLIDYCAILVLYAALSYYLVKLPALFRKKSNGRK